MIPTRPKCHQMFVSILGVCPARVHSDIPPSSVTHPECKSKSTEKCNGNRKRKLKFRRPLWFHKVEISNIWPTTSEDALSISEAGRQTEAAVLIDVAEPCFGMNRNGPKIR